MAQITRIEDITNIVGVDNYIKSLAFDMSRLEFIESFKKYKGMRFLFHFFEHEIFIDVDRNHNIYNMSCDCNETAITCPHIALAIMYLLKHEELITTALLELEEDSDSEFNKSLFDALAKQPIKREKVSLEVILKDIDYSDSFEYELQLKIGTKKKYVLNKRLEEFLQVYREQTETIEFGKDFTFDASIHYFDAIDSKIIEFLEFYCDSQNTTFRSYYGYYTPRASLNYIKLSGRGLSTFLQLLENKDFTYQQGYYGKLYHGIEPFYDFHFALEKISGKLKVNYNCMKLRPFTPDYHYLIDADKMYYCASPKLYKMLMQKKTKQLVFDSLEYENFASIVLPSMKQLNPNISVPEELKEELETAVPLVRYYFDLKDDTLVCTIKLFYKDTEENIFSLNTKFNNVYVVRNQLEEQKYIEEVENYGFVVDSNEMSFYLTNQDLIVHFMEHGLPKLTETYDVFVSKNLKTFNVIQKTTVESSFKIGRDNILSFHFKIDGVSNNEIQTILDSIKEKKKYYRLKNGSWMNLEDANLSKFSTMMDTLDIGKNDLSKEDIQISRYRMIGLESLENEYDFVKLANEIHTVIDQFKNYKNIEVKFTKEENKLLRGYQKTGIQWMMMLSSCGFGGILADEMGLGKSLQTIKYIEKRKQQVPNAKFLIVVPTSLVYNWQNEFIKYKSPCTVISVLDNKKKREEILAHFGDYDVYITTYGLLRQDILMYKDLMFDTCIIDEAQNIKNINTETTKAIKEIKSINHFALTGTPIENSALELFSIFDFIMPGFFGTVNEFKQKYSIKKIEEDKNLLKNLNQKVSPFILRRKKSDVLKELPAKIENNIYVDLSVEQKKLYVAYLEKTKKQIDEALQSEGFMKSQILILSLLTKLREICIDPHLLVKEYTGESAKMDIVLDIIKQNIQNGHKMLLFSQFPSALRIVREHLLKNKIASFYLDGSTKSKERMKLVEEFNQNEIPVFLISLKAGGTGLNLTSADVVIHLDPWWNPQVENQATDRSHRIGQKNVVEVVKVITKGTIEEKIIELQEKKKHLSDAIIEGENRDQIVLSKLTETELKNLLMNEK